MITVGHSEPINKALGLVEISWTLPKQKRLYGMTLSSEGIQEINLVKFFTALAITVQRGNSREFSRAVVVYRLLALDKGPNFLLIGIGVIHYLIPCATVACLPQTKCPRNCWCEATGSDLKTLNLQWTRCPQPNFGGTRWVFIRYSKCIQLIEPAYHTTKYWSSLTTIFLPLIQDLSCVSTIYSKVSNTFSYKEENKKHREPLAGFFPEQSSCPYFGIKAIIKKLSDVGIEKVGQTSNSRERLK